MSVQSRIVRALAKAFGPVQLGSAGADARVATDALTGVSTQHAFNAELERERDRLARVGGSAWLLLVDLDGFKQVNDRFGHNAGDLVLVEVASRLRRAVGGRGLLARIGGDEFALLIRPNLGESALLDLVGELERAVSAEPIVLGDGKSCAIEVTIGTAALNGSTAAVDVLRLADERMYLGKRRAGSDPFDRVSELIVGLLDPSADGVERALASGIAEVAQGHAVYVEYPGGEQWWPAEPPVAVAEPLRALAGMARQRDDVLEQGAYRLAAPLRGDGASIGAFAVARSHPFAKPDRIALARAGVALGQALLRLHEGVAVRRRIDELEHLAFCDENTGLANRRALLAELERRAADTDPLTLLFVDFDGLRAVNNELSYEHGNELLRAVAAGIEQTLRPGELAARLHGSGGDEFIVVAPGIDAIAAPTRATELEEVLVEVELAPPVARLYGGASVGYALRVAGEPSLELVERAAKLMRERKRLRAAARALNAPGQLRSRSS